MNQFGTEWQCTELVVRWAAAAWGEGNFNAWKLAGWDGAAQDMWKVTHLVHPLKQLANGSATQPQFGDLIIFHELPGISGPGHVGVVLSVNRATGKLTFISENNGGVLGAVVQVPITSANHVSTTGFSGNLTVTGWMRPAAPTTTVAPTSGYPTDPICKKYGFTQPNTMLTVSGTYYTPETP